MSNLNLLLKFYEEEKSYIKATNRFIDEVLDLDISEFNISDLPKDWVELIRMEANQKKLLKIPENYIKKNSFDDLLKNEKTKP